MIKNIVMLIITVILVLLILKTKKDITMLKTEIEQLKENLNKSNNK